MHIYVGKEPFSIGQVAGKAIGPQVEGRGQLHVHSRQVHLAHVASCHGIDGERIVGPLAAKTFRHVGHEHHQVVLAEGTMNGNAKLTRRVLVEGVQV